MEAEALVGTFPDTLSKVVAKLKTKALSVTVADLTAEALLHALCDTIAVVKAKTM